MHEGLWILQLDAQLPLVARLFILVVRLNFRRHLSQPLLFLHMRVKGLRTADIDEQRLRSDLFLLGSEAQLMLDLFYLGSKFPDHRIFEVYFVFQLSNLSSLRLSVLLGGSAV
jgi:hypothetical protein